MNVRKLKKELGRGCDVRRKGRNEIRVVMPGGDFTVDRKSGWTEAHMAEYLRSRVPVMTLGPKIS